MSNATGVGTSAPEFNPTASKPALKCSIEYQDPEGERATSTFYVSQNGGDVSFGDWPVSMLTAIAAHLGAEFQTLTNAQVLNFTIGPTLYGPQLRPQVPSTGTRNIEDKAFIYYETATKKPIKFKVPAPVVNWLADQETLDPSSGTLNSFSTDIISGDSIVVPDITGGNANYIVSTADGEVVATYNLGHVERAKTRRKVRAGIATEMGG